MKPTSSLMKRTATGLLAVGILTAAGTGAYLATPWNSAKAANDQTATTPLMAPVSFSSIAEKVTPAVVNIATTIKSSPAMSGIEMQGMQGGMQGNTPFDEFFRRFFGPGQPMPGQPGQPEMHALGSGFVISADGYVVTNNHVVENATEISVITNDGTHHPAKLIGTDPKTDLALLKIDSDGHMPYVEFGNSDAAKVGDWVMAVGNPFGLGGTITAGIISARGRDLQSGPYDDFIQIDAPINKGNSGGPTFNLSGQVIGINTAIYSPNGGSVGIGFAIPSNLAKTIVAELRTDGKVSRGWLGVQIQQVTPDIAEGLGMKDPAGALVVAITPDSPAEAAGLKPGDVIVRFDKQAIDSLHDLPRLVAGEKNGTHVRLIVLRDGSEKMLPVTIGKMPGEAKVAAADTGEAGSKQNLGMSTLALSSETRQQFQIPDSVTGVLVTGVRDESAAAKAGIQPGDIIERVGSTEVVTPSDIDSAVSDARHQDRKSVLAMINRRGSERFVALPLEKA